MNSCVLMAEIVKAPELRYLPDGQTAIAEMTVQFPALRAEDPMEHLKVVGWGNLAQQIQEQFQVGEQVVLEGRLTMALIDRPEGFKEKRAELTISRIHHVQADLNAPRIASTPAPTSAPAVPAQPKATVPAAPTAPATPTVPAMPKASVPPTVPAPAVSAPAVSKPPEIDPSFEPDYNDIPF